MNTDIHILIIDDDDLHLKVLNMKLNKMGYTNIQLINNYDAAGSYLDEYIPDIIIIDYYLDNGLTGVDFMKEFLLNKGVAVIFISVFYSEELFKDVVEFGPMDFLQKNVSDFELSKSIQLSLIKKKKFINNAKLKDYIFLRAAKEIKKVALVDVGYITVDGKYLELYVKDKKYLIRSTLNEFEKKLPDYFVKIHKAYIINLKFLDSISIEDSTVKVGESNLPFSRHFKKDLFSSYYLP